MKYNPDIHNRRSIRLKDYDYTRDGAYFVTVYIKYRERLLGTIENGEINLSQYGHIVHDAWLWLEKQYPYVTLDEWIIMPDHMHGIVVIGERPRCKGGSRTALTTNTALTPKSMTISTPPRRKPLGQLIGAFKTVSTKQINTIRQTPGVPLWQRNYFDRVIRSEKELNLTRKYIEENPCTFEEEESHENHHWPQNILYYTIQVD